METDDRAETNVTSSTSRRRFLNSLAGTTGVIATSTTLFERASAAEAYSHDYDTVVNLKEVGADPTGDQPVNRHIEKYAGDNTLLYFPPGRYLMDRQFRSTGFTNFGLVGNDATLVPANFYNFDGEGKFNYRLFRLGTRYDPGTNLEFRNFTVDQTAEDTGIRVLDTSVTDGLVVKNIDIRGQHDSGTWGPGRFVIDDPNGEGLVERFHAPDGGAWSMHTPTQRLWKGPTGIISNTYNRGTITFRDCRLGSFPDSGLYAANGTGQIVVEGGVYKNSNTASIRIGGRDSIIKNATAVVDKRSGRGNQHAIRLENSNYVRLLDSDVRVTEPNGSAIRTFDVNLVFIDSTTVTTRGYRVVHGLETDETTKSVRVKNSKFDHDVPGGYSIWIRNGEDPSYVENTSLVGDGAHRIGRSAIRCDGNDCQFRDVNIHQTGSPRRRGIEIKGRNCLLVGGQYVVGEFPVVNEANNTWIEDIYADSTDGNEAVKLYPSGDNVYIKESRVVDGVLNLGSKGLRTKDNTYQ